MAPRTAKKVAVVAVESPVAPAVPAVVEAELRDIVKLRRDIADLQSTLRASKQTLDIKEADIIGRLRKGAKLEGKLVAVVEMVKGRCSVSWKDVAMKFAVKLGLNPAAVEKDEKAAKEATLVPEPTLLISGDAVEQYVGTEVGK